ncbi:hypothetical protein HRR83_004968 [Exophiala dermatitidis]|uniref:Uncharacterized protein n=1 Tax=Exophiala dermatitidis TaxID=5970 RepID=A0AAN6IUV1_EXODE|nr:hypothetical protein HRR74_004867 [Exophiala dermatitidis]KAJ4519705.1 hypothetical protein HRR73_003765 [Exophiala dermatitidis]KAJ4534492.1 hypothetical protein HRR76_006417 [Exophiala dermatitidis]KAJ4551163.1 hypothetical protein HRR77_003506 [Exophiala dermatitidis]KAJ4561034.1 hypothetical protein HRR79_007595 [Exophiala dermatitidis]
MLTSWPAGLHRHVEKHDRSFNTSNSGGHGSGVLNRHDDLPPTLTKCYATTRKYRTVMAQYEERVSNSTVVHCYQQQGRYDLGKFVRPQLTQKAGHKSGVWWREAVVVQGAWKCASHTTATS